MLESKILLIPDTHFVFKNPDNRINLIQEGFNILDWIIATVNENNIDTVIFLGDTFDRGYPNIDHTVFSEYYKRISYLSKTLRGKLYFLLGNHEYTYSKGNPIFHWLEMGEEIKYILKDREKFPCKESLIQSPSFIESTNTMIRFHHFNPQGIYEYWEKKPYQIGLFHDTLSTVNIEYMHSVVDVNEWVDHYDYIFTGHIHIPQEIVKYQNKRNTQIIIPGAMLARTKVEVHEFTNVPLIEIYTDKKPEVKYIPYRLPDFIESFDINQVNRDKAAYEFRKILKKTEKIAKTVGTSVEMEMAAEDLGIKHIIDEATDTINLKTVQVLKDKWGVEIREGD